MVIEGAKQHPPGASHPHHQHVTSPTNRMAVHGSYVRVVAAVRCERPREEPPTLALGNGGGGNQKGGRLTIDPWDRRGIFLEGGGASDVNEVHDNY